MAYNIDERRCMKCNRKQSYLYYCEDCHETFCSECVISEKTECSFCNVCSHISIGNKCEICGKANNLSAAKRYLKKCPICSSIKIKDIPKKITGINNEFSETINHFYNGYDIIKNFSTKYSEIVTQAKFLRRERFGLYPVIENNLIRIQGQFFEITQRASELAERVYQQIAQDVQLLHFNQQITVNKLPHIDRILKLIRTHTQSYTNLITDFLNDSQQELNEVETLVNELKYYQQFFDENVDKFETEMLELKIAVFLNVKVALPESRRNRTGLLFITNKHLYFMPMYKFLWKFRGRVRAIPLSLIKDVETKESRIFGSKIVVNIPDKKKMKIKCSLENIERLNFLFGSLFNENEGYIITDPYLLEELKGNLDYAFLRDKIDKKVKDLKQIPYSQLSRAINWERGPVVNLPIENEEVKSLRIKLRAAKDTLNQLQRAFDDRNITADIYFPRLERTQERIFNLEEQLKQAIRFQMGYRNSQDFSDKFDYQE